MQSMSTRATTQSLGIRKKTTAVTKTRAPLPTTTGKSVPITAATTTSNTSTSARRASSEAKIIYNINCNNLSDSSHESAIMQAVKIKKELPSDEIKEYAENTMNELLGWYGFDGVDRLDLSTKTTRLLQTAAAAAAATGATLSNSNNNNNNNSHNSSVLSQRHVMEKRRSRSSRAAALLQLQQHQQQQQQQQQQRQQQSEHMRSIISSNNNNNSNSANNNNNNNTQHNNNTNNSGSRKAAALSSYRSNQRNSLDGNSTALAGIGNAGGGGVGGGGGGGDSTTSDHDTRSSREEDSKSPPHTVDRRNAASAAVAAAATMEEKIDYQNCCWCRRPMPENGPEFLTTTDGPRYCSESCFSQSRRASFKKAKTCDWCKHVRHAISYVDFQDGASQLQFCSDKCLNQYKMQIFCKETQAHLDMNPHLREQGLEAAAASNGVGLITPDLWLRNCRSRSASPASTLSVSPGPPPAIVMHNNSGLTTGSSSSPASSAGTATLGHATATHKPMISVAPVSKLMSKSPSMLAAAAAAATASTSLGISNRQSPKHNRRKRTLRGSTTAAELSANLKSNHGVMTRGDMNAAVDIVDKYKSLLSAKAANTLRTSPGNAMPNVKSSASGTLSQFAGSSVQDLHMSVPPLSPMLEPQAAPHALPPHVVNAGARGPTSIPPAYFATPTNAPAPTAAAAPHPTQLPHGVYPPHAPPPFLANPAGLLPRFLSAGGFAGLQQPPPQVAPTLPPHMLPAPPELMGGGGLGALLGAPPPVTVMVPYPIVIPLPIPIPVPLPVMDFYKAYLTPEERAKLKQQEEAQRRESTQSVTQSHVTEEQPMTAAATAASVCANSEGERKLLMALDTNEEQPLDFTKAKECDDVTVTHYRDAQQQQRYACAMSIEHDDDDDHDRNRDRFKHETCEDECLQYSASPMTPRNANTPTTPPTSATDTPLTTTPIPTPTPTPITLITPEAPTTPKRVEETRQPQQQPPSAATTTPTPTLDEDETHSSSCTSASTSGAGGGGGTTAAVTISEGGDEAKQKLPKFKITRLQTKRTLIQAKETTSAAAAAAECSRPLRKRKRIIDCDFQKIALKDATIAAEDDESSALPAEPLEAEAEADMTTATMTPLPLAETCNSNAKAYNKKL